jgi:hypothetical protein
VNGLPELRFQRRLMEFETTRPRVTPADIQAIAGDVEAQLTMALPDPEPQCRHGLPAFLTAIQLAVYAPAELR